MRRALLAGAVAMTFAVPARADMPVIDATAIVRLAQQIRQFTQMIQIAQMQLNQAIAQYESLVHLTNIGTMIPQLQTPNLQNPLPTMGNMQGIMAGLGGGPLAGLVQQNYQRNTVYEPHDDTWMSQHIHTDAQSIAGMQASAQQLYQSISLRIPLMQQLANRLNTATDPKDVMDLQARVQSEGAIIQSQATQAATLETWSAAQLAVFHQQEEEKRQKDIDEVLNADPDW